MKDTKNKKELVVTQDETKKIPHFIKNKIIFNKIIAFLQIIIALVLILSIAFIIFLYYYREYQDKVFQWSPFFTKIYQKIMHSLNIDLIPYPFFLIFFLIIFVFLFFYGFYNMIMIIKQGKKYRLSLKTDAEVIPEFIYSIYKKSLVYKVVARWFCSFYYLIALITLVIMILLEKYFSKIDPILAIGSWKLGPVKNLTSEIVITSASILIVLLFHCFFYLHAKKIRTQIITYWNKDILTPEVKDKLIKKTNWICFVIIAILLTLTLFILYLVLRKFFKQKDKSLLILKN